MSKLDDDFLKKELVELHRVRMASAGLFSEVWGESAKCECCGKTGAVARRPLNIRYVNEESNWMTSCLSCYQDAIEYYNDLWREVYR